ncbi:FGGY family carbohydrate kinase, partial [Microbacterium sp. GbtcB4]|uniref:FGGY family carbohydrate kinase n=1 Tax=Microbacterium sp. GbtcB4 TaxID=2824749 RepID=UPI0020C6EB9B
TGNKAAPHHDDGRLTAAAPAPYPAHFAAGGVAEQDPPDWWHAVVTATRDLPPRTGPAAAEVAGLGVSGQVVGAVVLD